MGRSRRWRAVGFPGLEEAPPVWHDRQLKMRAAMKDATGVPLFGVPWSRPAAPTPAPASTSKPTAAAMKTKTKKRKRTEK